IYAIDIGSTTKPDQPNHKRADQSKLTRQIYGINKTFVQSGMEWNGK
ncbi:25287_t:CDS:1, partial [Racocetra persica]